MKKSELRKLIREVISEQIIGSEFPVTPLGGSPSNAQIAPVLQGQNVGGMYLLRCPEGYIWGPWYSPVTACMQSPNYSKPPIRLEGEEEGPWGLYAVTTGCIPKDVDVAPQKDDDGKPGKGNIPTSPGAFNKPDPLGDAPVGGGVFGTANLGDLPSS